MKAAVLALGLLVGLWGLRWGVPDAGRLQVFPEGRPTPELTQYFADAWARLYEGIERSHREMREEPTPNVQGVQEFAPGWKRPPEPLVNSYRSSLLQSDHPDEKKSFIILSQMRPWRLEFKPFYIFYGGAFIYPLGAFLQASSWLRAVTLVADLRHYMAYPEQMGALYVCGRVFILLFHLATAWLLFDLGQRLSGKRAGLFAAAFFILCPAVVVHSHLLKPHPYAAFWAVAAARWMLKAYAGGDRRDYLLCGLAAGMAAGSNFSLAALCGLPVLALLARRFEKTAAASTGPEARTACLGAACGVAVFVASNPYLVFGFRDFAWDMAYVAHTRKFILANIPAMAATIMRGMGPVLGALSLGGAAAALRAKGERRLLAVVFWGLFAWLWFQFSRFADEGSLRLFYPVLALGCLLAGDLANAAFASKRLRGAVLAAVLLDSGSRSFVYLENMRLHSTAKSTRARSVAWIQANIPPNATVGLARYPEPAHTPRFRLDLYRLVIFDRPQALPAARLPQYLVFDRLDNAIVAGWAAQRYDLAASFSPFELPWARVDPDSFINGPMFIYRLRERS